MTISRNPSENNSSIIVFARAMFSEWRVLPLRPVHASRLKSQVWLSHTCSKVEARKLTQPYCSNSVGHTVEGHGRISRFHDVLHEMRFEKISEDGNGRLRNGNAASTSDVVIHVSQQPRWPPLEQRSNRRERQLIMSLTLSQTLQKQNRGTDKYV